MLAGADGVPLELIALVVAPDDAMGRVGQHKGARRVFGRAHAPGHVQHAGIAGLDRELALAQAGGGRHFAVGGAILCHRDVVDAVRVGGGNLGKPLVEQAAGEINDLGFLHPQIAIGLHRNGDVISLPIQALGLGQGRGYDGPGQSQHGHKGRHSQASQAHSLLWVLLIMIIRQRGGDATRYIVNWLTFGPRLA